MKKCGCNGERGRGKLRFDSSGAKSFMIGTSIASFIITGLAIADSIWFPDSFYGIALGFVAALEVAGAHAAHKRRMTLSVNLSILVAGVTLQGMLLYGIVCDFLPIQSGIVMVALNQVLLISCGMIATHAYQPAIIMASTILAMSGGYYVLASKVEIEFLRFVGLTGSAITAMSATVAWALFDLREKLKRTALMRKAFISSMSHELRNPLSALVGFCRLLSERNLEPSIRTDIHHILGATEHLKLLIEILFELYKQESSPTGIRNKPVRVEEIKSTLTSNLKLLASELDVRYTIEGEIQEGLAVCTEKQSLVIALTTVGVGLMRQNLPGTVFRILISSSENSLSIVMGNSPGLEYFRSGVKPVNHHNFRKKKRGHDRQPIMMLVSNFIKGMGHDFSYSEDENLRLCVVTIPLVDTKLIQSTVPLASSKRISRNNDDEAPYRVLYVEDDLANRHLMEMIFKLRRNWELRTANTGELGIEEAKSFKPHLVIMDIGLPGISGIEATKRLRANLQTRAIPVLALTANIELRRDAPQQNSIFDAVVAKPFDVDDLISLIESFSTDNHDGGDGRSDDTCHSIRTQCSSN